MNYIDKLSKYIQTKATCYKPNEEEFWYWLNNYDPKEDGLEYVRESFVPAGYKVYRLKRFPNMDYLFYYRDWTGQFTIYAPVDEQHLQMAAKLNKKTRDRFQCRGADKDWNTKDTILQFNKFKEIREL